jgi:uncharacterized protein YjbJ (UPF0337 family)
MENKVSQDEYWEEIKEKLKETHVELTDEDLNIRPGRINEFLGRLSKKLNKTKEQVNALIESIAANNTIAG